MPATALKIGTLDDYLDRICEEIQLRQTQFITAVRRYTAVGKQLTERESPLERLSPAVFPQGSMLQRTTIRPMRLSKQVVPYDIDTVCRCDFDPYSKTSQSLYGSVLARLVANVDFQKRIEEAKKELGTSGKCIRLAYTDDDFYLDVVPTCKDPSDAEGIRLYMCNPDRWTSFAKPIETWRRTDPFRFAAWLQVRCEVGHRLVEKRAVASVAPVPPQEEADVKAPLRRVVQLLKRVRDVEFLGDKCRPTSIMLTTLAGRHYRGEESIADGLETVVNGIASQINASRPGRIAVPNPADELAP
ncbi:MAG: nucleotidyltransferase, partial [Bdellovibrionales bacterium]|nr:nucleotidyltransferase [Bdellovibrionales bacterium]